MSNPGTLHTHGVHDALGLERLVFFSDAVMAIAITLLAIDLRLPGPRAQTNEMLLASLGAVAPRLFAFIVSFAVIAVYWVAHHRMFRYIVRYDGGLLVRNLLFLFFVALVPFTTSVLGEEGNLTWAAVVYAAGMAAMGFAATALWQHAVKHGLISPAAPASAVAHQTSRSLTVPIVFLASIPLAFVSPIAAQISWAAIFPVQKVLARRVRRRTN